MPGVTAPVLAAAMLLVVAGVPKLLRPATMAGSLRAMRLPAGPAIGRSVGAAEVLIGGLAMLAPTALTLFLLFAAYTLLAVAAARLLAIGAGDCGCFAARPTPPSRAHVALNIAFAAAAGTAAVTGWDAPPPATLEGSALLLTGAAIALLTYTMMAAQGTVAPAGPSLAARLAQRTAGATGAGVTRRSFLSRTALVGTALAVAPADFILRPVSAYAAVCNCSGQGCNCGALCCDGWTEFCCTIYGANACPPGSIAAGWWKADGSGLCDGQSRYYIDCNGRCNGCGCGGAGICSGGCTDFGCGCANGNCGNRKAGCTSFRYGQCNADVACVGPIVCRVVTCTPPWQWDPSCTTTVAVDNNTRFHDAPCLHADPGAPVVAVPGGLVVMGDWNGDGVKTPGIVANGVWYLRNSNNSGPADTVFAFGDPTDIPVVGDWNGDGRDGPGVVRDGRWFLRHSRTAGPADLSFPFGNPGDIPIVGDWNGDGIDTPGVVRAGVWHLRNSNAPGPADLSFAYGNPGDTPVVGDWDGDGRDGIGVVRRGTWHLRNALGSGVADLSFTFGNPDDIPLAGDWDGDGSAGPGVVRGASWYLRDTPGAGVANLAFTYGTSANSRRLT